MKAVIPRLPVCLRITVWLLICGMSACSRDGGTTEENLIRYTRAGDMYAQGRFAEALSFLEGTGDFPPALALRAKAEYFSGELDKAEKSCRQAIRRRPSAFEAKLYLARILRDRGDSAGAEQAAESLLADNPQDIRALRFASGIARERGKADQASALLDRAAELSAECALVLLDRARLRWIAGRGAEALEDLVRARAMLPPDTPLSRSVEHLENRIKEVM